MTRALAGVAAVLLAMPATAATAARPSPEFVITTPAGNLLLSSLKGKVVVLEFFFTTCPRCQHSSQVLSAIQKEYRARGVQVLGSAFNEGTAVLIPEFIRRFKPPFPAGFNTRAATFDFLEHPPNVPSPAPILVFIDRKRIIRAQYLGSDAFLANEDKNIRALLDSLLKEKSK